MGVVVRCESIRIAPSCWYRLCCTLVVCCLVTRLGSVIMIMKWLTFNTFVSSWFLLTWWRWISWKYRTWLVGLRTVINFVFLTMIIDFSWVHDSRIAPRLKLMFGSLFWCDYNVCVCVMTLNSWWLLHFSWTPLYRKLVGDPSTARGYTIEVGYTRALCFKQMRSTETGREEFDSRTAAMPVNSTQVDKLTPTDDHTTSVDGLLRATVLFKL